MKYEVGDKIRIVSIRDTGPDNEWASSGHMDCWLGTIMTIVKIELDPRSGRSYYRMEEDQLKWAWFEEMISGPAHELVLNISELESGKMFNEKNELSLTFKISVEDHGKE